MSTKACISPTLSFSIRRSPFFSMSCRKSSLSSKPRLVLSNSMLRLSRRKRGRELTMRRAIVRPTSARHVAAVRCCQRQSATVRSKL
eukprot:2996487-Pyramimonas_sp.AAC.1